MVTQNLGIDISAEDFHVCLKVRRPDSSIKVKGQRKFKNNYSGFKQLKTWLEKKMLPGQPLHVTMEATGVYHQTLAYFLYECGYKIHILLPNRTKAYFRFLHLKSKTDKIDTLALAELGISHPLDDWQPPKPLLRQLKSLSRERLTLSKDRTVIRSRIHAEEKQYKPVKQVLKRLKQQLKLIEKQIAQVEAEMLKLLDKDPVLKEKVLKCTVKGVGLISVISIVAETEGFSQFRNKSQLVSYAGYDVVQRQSGTSVLGKTRISKKGNSNIRRILYFPAINVVKYHEEFKNLYQRIYDRTGIKMKGYVAAQRKVLVLIYTLFTKNVAYDPEHYKKYCQNHKNHELQTMACTG